MASRRIIRTGNPVARATVRTCPSMVRSPSRRRLLSWPIRWLSPPARMQTSQFLIKSVPGAAKHVAHFVAHQFLHLTPRGAKELSRIEFFWIIHKNSAYRCGHGEPQISVNVYLGASDAASHFDVRLGHAGCISAELSPVLIYFVNQILGDAGGPVQNERIIAESCVH